jgi:MoaA/NifB/PqqE/SkfB family radical SAM enzyme
LRDDEPLAVDCLNVEVSLHCQARCAMCCVEAPAWSGRYDYYDTLSRLVDRLHPRSIMVQGGEVLVQKKTMAWLKQIKARHDDISLSLVTNGNAGLAAARDAEDLFDLITVSLVGIQKETYRKIMGLDLDKTLAFIDRLLAGKKTRVHLKYLCTASNIHEAGLFLDQAVAMRTHSISIADSEILKYIDLSPQDDYWFKIFSRTGQDIKNRLLQLRDDPSKNNITVYIEKPLQTIFGIDDAFIEANNLENMLG